MEDGAKYLIHADITANGVVERNDVIGAIFGQTEGMLGDELDLRELQDHSKVGRIDVDVESERGQSFGKITIASGLDRVETALLAASLETIERVGPCRAAIEVSDLEDVRSAKRRAIVERATELLAKLEAESVTSMDIVEEVRQRVRVEDVTEYEGLPAGPRVPDSDAIIVVEGRADVLQLLQYGIKNAIAVEGTDVPEAVADLTKHRTVTAFLDGDRGGELILKELVQVGAVDYVAFAPTGTAVEDLSRGQILTALREKVPYETFVESGDVEAAVDGGARTEPSATDAPAEGEESVSTAATGAAATVTSQPAGDAAIGERDAVVETPGSEASAADEETEASGTERPLTIPDHVQTVIRDDSGLVRFLDEDGRVIDDGPVADAFDLLEGTDVVPPTVVLDGPVSQRLLDVAAQRGVDRVVAASEGEFVKRPTNVRVRTADEF